MMKINSKKRVSRTKKMLIAAAILAVIVAGIYAVFALNDGSKTENNTAGVKQNGIDYSPPTDDQKDAGDRQKEEAISTPEASASSGDDQDISVSFTAINQSDGQLQIRTLIETVSDNGSCTLTLTKGDVTVTKQSEIQAGPNSSTCKGFNVATNELAPGTWRIALAVDVGAQKGTVSKDYVVQ